MAKCAKTESKRLAAVGKDRWGQELPSRLLAAVLEFSPTARDILVVTQRVCAAWRLVPSGALERLWKSALRHELEWTEELPPGAPGGAAAAEFRRVWNVEKNWAAGRAKVSSKKLVPTEGRRWAGNRRVAVTA